MPHLRSRKTSLFAQMQEGSLGIKKGRECHSMINMDMHPYNSAVGSVLAKKIAHAFLGVLGPLRCEKKEQLAKGKQKNRQTVLCK